MKTVQAIEKREDTSPEEGKGKYGDVKFADEKNKKYPVDTEAHARAALSYWGMPKNRAKYSAEDQKTIGGKIRAAAKKFGIETSDDDDDKDKAESSLVYAATAIYLEGETPDEIVYMPAGEAITIKPRSHGKEIVVKVDANAAETLQADLTKRWGAPVRPYAGFDHNPLGGPASFLPKAFKWDQDRGVILEVDWTEKGKGDVAGRNYSYFSPTFMVKGKQVAGLPETGEVGSLVNNPAFRDPKMKVAAANADDDQDEKGNGMQECPKCGHKFKSKKTEAMDGITEKLVELEVITAEQAELADEGFIVRAVTGLHEGLATVQAANARLVSENTALQAKVADVQKAEAASIVEAAIAEGRIGAKDQSMIDYWIGQITANPEQAKKALATVTGASGLLQKVIDVKVKDSKRTAAGQSEGDLIEAQHRAVRMVKEKHPGLNHTDAFNRAKEEYPEAFPVEA
jgi:phage I-like protein